jgi:hypothetical protein
MSKKCKYELLRGANKGQKCNKNCRGDFCKLHKPTYLDKKAQYNNIKNEKLKEKTKEKKFKKIEKMNELNTSIKKTKKIIFLKVSKFKFIFSKSFKITKIW